MPTLRSFAPIIFPVNWTSETLSDGDDRVAQLQRVVAPLMPEVAIQPVDWPLGYGSLDHDALPLFCQPSAALRVPVDEDFTERLPVSLATSCIDLYCYDDALAIAVIDFTWQDATYQPDDGTVTHAVSQLLTHAIAPIAQSLCNALSDNSGALLAPGNYYNFSDYSQHELTAAEPLWVARMALLDVDLTEEQRARWSAWARADDAGKILLVGSGNSVCMGTEHDHRDALRAMVLCQFHAALMWQLERLFMARLGQFNVRINHSKRIRQGLALAGRIEQQIDHLDYVVLQFSTALYCTQGLRREMTQELLTVWQLDQQQDTVVRIAELLKRRIHRLSEERSAYQNRMIQQMLGIIGGLSVIDLFLAVTGFSRDYPDDDVPGLLDLVTQVPNDHMLSASLLLVTIIAMVVVRYQR